MHILLKIIILLLSFCEVVMLMRSPKVGLLPDSSFKSYNIIGPKLCAKECSLHPRCLSYNYNEEKFYCELNHRVIGTDNITVEHHQSFVYREKDSMSQNLRGKCFLSGCPAHTKCVYIKNVIHCVPIGCGDPLTIGNGTVSPGVYNFDETVMYACYDGFLLVGAVRICLRSGDWTGNDVSCVLRCVTPATTVPFVVINSGDEQGDIVGSTRTLRCKTFRYVESGSDIITCNDFGSWSAVELTCNGCGYPPDVPDGRWTHTYSKVGTSIISTCNDGYTTSDPSGQQMPTITCQSNNSWSDFNYTCKEYGCGPPPTYIGAIVNIRTSNSGDHRNYTCKTGFRQTQQGYIICNANETWEEIVNPNCTRVDCGPPLEYNGAEVSEGYTTYNHERTYTCSMGYESNQNAVPYIRCGADGQWIEGVQPNCSRMCPVSYIWQQEHRLCFKRFDVNLTWNEANMTCASQPNGMLLVIDTASKLNVVRQCLNDQNQYWIRLNEHSYGTVSDSTSTEQYLTTQVNNGVNQTSVTEAPPITTENTTVDQSLVNSSLATESTTVDQSLVNSSLATESTTVDQSLVNSSLATESTTVDQSLVNSSLATESTTMDQSLANSSLATESTTVDQSLADSSLATESKTMDQSLVNSSLATDLTTVMQSSMPTTMDNEKCPFLNSTDILVFYELCSTKMFYICEITIVF